MKSEWKTAHANEKRIRFLFHSVFLYLNAGTSRMLFCHLERQSRGLLQRQIPRLRSSGPSLGTTNETSARNDSTSLTITRKTSNSAKTVGKRNSFPGFSFFECFSVALFLFLSCGDAGVSSAFGLVVLVWFVFLFIFAYE